MDANNFLGKYTEQPYNFLRSLWQNFAPEEILTVNGLTAIPGIGQVVLVYTVPANSYASSVEVWASLTNDRSVASHVGDGSLTTLTHISAQQGGPFYYWARGKDPNGNVGEFFPTSPTGGVVGQPNNIPNTPGFKSSLVNGSLRATVDGSGNLTIAVKTQIGNADPSPSNPVFLVYPLSGTSAAGYSFISITSPCSITLHNGSSLGTVNSLPFRVWVLIAVNGGLPEMTVVVCTDGSSIFPLGDIWQIATTAEGGGTATLWGTPYSTNGIGFLVPYAVVGHFVWSNGLPAAGNWTSGPGAAVLFTEGSPLPGDVLQPVQIQSASQTTVSAVIPEDNTIPQDSEGTEILSAVFPFTVSAANLILHDVEINGWNDSTRNVIVSLFKNGVTDAIAVNMFGGYVGSQSVRVQHLTRLFGTAQTWKARVGLGSAGGNFYVNGDVGGAARFGGILRSNYRLTEIMA